MNQKEKRILVIIALFLWIYLWLRAFYVPLVHDEIAGYFNYYQHFEFLPFYALWDAGNHYLNTFLSCVFVNVLGPSELTFRLANLLIFPYFIYGLFKLLPSIKNRPGQYLLIASLLFNQFIIDFFALSRGYGLGLAFMINAIGSLINEHNQNNRLKFAQVNAVLAVLSNFIFLFLPFAILLYQVIRLNTYRYKTTDYFFGGITFLLILFAAYSQRLGLYYYGNQIGFLPTTVGTLLKNYLGIESFLITLLMVAITLALIIYHYLNRNSSTSYITLLMSGVAFCIIGVNRWFLNGNYPEDRTAIYIIVLVMIMIAGCGLAKLNFIKWITTTALFIYFLQQTNLSQTVFWSNEMIPNRFFEKVKNDTDATINAFHARNLQWAWQNYQSGITQFQINNFPHPPQDLADYVICEKEYFHSHKYHEIDFEPASKLSLFKRTSKKHRILVETLPFEIEIKPDTDTIFYQLPTRKKDWIITVHFEVPNQLPRSFLSLQLFQDSLIAKEKSALNFLCPEGVKNSKAGYIIHGNFVDSVQLRIKGNCKDKYFTFNGLINIFELK